MTTPQTAEHQLLLDRVMEECLHDDRRLYDTLSIHERKLVVEWISEAVVTGEARTAMSEALWEVDFAKQPVTPLEFLTSEEYIGVSMSNLYPMWKEVLCHVLDAKNQIVEFILTGAIGTGKTFATTAAMAYKIYWLSCLHDPARYYGLSSKSKIVFGFYAVTKKQAADVGYYRLRSYFEHSPYFQNHFPYNPRLETKTSFIHQPIEVLFGSKAFHSLGLDLLGFAIDEANFFQDKKSNNPGQGSTNLAKELYDSACARLYSRYMRPGGVIPGIICLPSSRNAQNSFLEDVIAKRKGQRGVYIADYSQWDVKGKHKYFLPSFGVQVGDRTIPSKVLQDPVAFDIIQQFQTQQINEAAVRALTLAADTAQREKAKPGAQVVEVPGEYLDRFKEDTDQALRDIAGIATFNVSPLIRDRESVFDCIRNDLFHPFTVQDIVLDLWGDGQLQEVFDMKKACKIVDGKWTPKLNPKSLRYLHVDLAKNGDSAAIAMCHASHSVRIKAEKPDGTMVHIRYPYIISDFMLRIDPPAGSEIDHGKIRQFILYLRDLYPIKAATFDGFQSLASIQVLRKSGMHCRELSVDRKEDPYLSLRSALHERRFGMYRYEHFIDEVLDLQRDIKTHKVDHPVKSTKGGKGRKDVADAVCGSYYLCMEDEDNLHHEVADTWGVVMEYRPHAPGFVAPVTLPITQAPDLGTTKIHAGGEKVTHVHPQPSQQQPLPNAGPAKVAGIDLGDLVANLDD